MKNDSQIIIYQTKDGKTKLQVKFEGETAWLSQAQMAELFDCSIDNISLHLKNIFKEKELDKHSVIEEYSITAADGKKYKTKHYNLDAIIAVGYRVNSVRGTQFRQWATERLKEYMIKGFTLDDIKDIIYNEDGQDCLTDIIAMFDNGLGVTELENVLELVNDAWNFFPHKTLGGLSPEEKLLEYQKTQLGN